MLLQHKITTKESAPAETNAGGKTFFILSEKNFTEAEKNFIHADAVIISINQRELIAYLVKKIRQHDDPAVYLKPVFVTGPEGAEGCSEGDGCISDIHQTDEIIPAVNRIQFLTAQLNAEKPGNWEEATRKKLLNFIFTREINELVPHADKHSPFGYSYPELQKIFSDLLPREFLGIMERAQQEELFAGEFAEKVYLCSECCSGMLNYREVCPHCNSVNTSCEDLVHHFPCARISPISDFRKKDSDELECPKCNKHLKHIGVDYDKPSVYHHCNHCDKNFQDIFVKAKCLCCGKDNEVEYLIQKDINRFTVTKKARLVAVNGWESVKNGEARIHEGTVSSTEFQVLLKQKHEKINAGLLPDAVIASIRFPNMEKLFGEGGITVRDDIMKNLVPVMKDHFHPDDFIYCRTDVDWLVFLHNINPEDSGQLMGIVKENLDELFQSNFKGFTPEVLHRFLVAGSCHDFNPDNLFPEC